MAVSTTVLGDGYILLPSGTTAERPASPQTGHFRYNSTLKATEYWNGIAWISDTVPDGTSSVTAAPSATYILNNGYSTGSKNYWIKGASSSPFETYCDMTTAGGGWIGVMNVDTNDGRSHWWSDTSWWQGYNTTTPSGGWGSFLQDHAKSNAFNDYTSWSEIMIMTHQEGTFKAYGRWQLLSGYLNYSFYQLMNLAQGAQGTKITGSRLAQSGSTGYSNNGARPGNSSLLCEFTDSYGGYELRVNWYGDGNGQSKYSCNSDTVNYVRLTTGVGDPTASGCMGYEHSFSGFGGHHERPRGAYVKDFDFQAYVEYCDTPTYFSQNAGQQCSQGGYLNIDGAIFIR